MTEAAASGQGKTDSIYTIKYKLPKNTKHTFTILNGHCTNWQCKEDIAGQKCASGQWSDRAIEVEAWDKTVNIWCVPTLTNDPHSKRSAALTSQNWKLSA